MVILLHISTIPARAETVEHYQLRGPKGGDGNDKDGRLCIYSTIEKH